MDECRSVEPFTGLEIEFYSADDDAKKKGGRRKVKNNISGYKPENDLPYTTLELLPESYLGQMQCFTMAVVESCKVLSSEIIFMRVLGVQYDSLEPAASVFIQTQDPKKAAPKTAKTENEKDDVVKSKHTPLFAKPGDLIAIERAQTLRPLQRNSPVGLIMPRKRVTVVGSCPQVFRCRIEGCRNLVLSRRMQETCPRQKPSGSDSQSRESKKVVVDDDNDGAVTKSSPKSESQDLGLKQSKNPAASDPAPATGELESKDSQDPQKMCHAHMLNTIADAQNRRMEFSQGTGTIALSNIALRGMNTAKPLMVAGDAKAAIGGAGAIFSYSFGNRIISTESARITRLKRTSGRRNDILSEALSGCKSVGADYLRLIRKIDKPESQEAIEAKKARLETERRSASKLNDIVQARQERGDVSAAPTSGMIELTDSD